MDAFDLSRRLSAEALGTGILVATVVGSGIMAETLTKDTGLALLCNTLPTGAILVVLITVLGPISGAHFNPAVTLVFACKRELPLRDAALYVIAQIMGGIAGTVAAHLMFALPVIEFSIKARTGGAQWFAEAIAAFGLIATILGGIRFQRMAVPWLVGLYITAAYWFTASTSFRAIALQYVFRHPSDGPAGIHCRRIFGSARRHAVVELAAQVSRGAGPRQDCGDISMSVAIDRPPHPTSITSTATLSFCLGDPTMMPSTGETSEKSRPTPRMM